MSGFKYNASNNEINLNGLIVKDNGNETFTVNDDIRVLAGEYVVFGLNEDPSVNGGINVDFEYAGFTLANGDDEIILYYGNTTIDEVAYDGGPLFPVLEGKINELRSGSATATKNDQGVAWCAALSAMANGDFGTPGVPNDDCGEINVNDLDQDGFEAEPNGDDCDDGDPTINPNATEIPDDGIDQDCDGADAEGHSQ